MKEKHREAACGSLGRRAQRSGRGTQVLLLFLALASLTPHVTAQSADPPPPIQDYPKALSLVNKWVHPAPMCHLLHLPQSSCLRWLACTDSLFTALTDIR